jgi:hypothetical protein
MKVIIPESLNEITLKQYLDFKKLVDADKYKDHELIYHKVSIFTNLDYAQCRNIGVKDLADLSVLIDNAIETDYEFEQTFTFDGVEYGFIPNLDKITTGEWVDLMNYQNDDDDLNKLMAILFRPIVKKDSFNNYTIESYNGTEGRAEVMYQLPFSIVKGAIGFFLNLLSELLGVIPKYTDKELAKA